MWLLLYLATMTVVTLKLPSMIQDAERSLPKDLREDIGNEQLADTAITLGAHLGLLMYAIAALLIVVALRYYERQLRHTRALRSGTGFALGPTLVAAATGRLADLTFSAELLSWGTLAAFGCAITFTCGVFLRRTSRIELKSLVLAIAVSAALTVLA